MGSKLALGVSSMTINRQHWWARFTSLPTWQCPTCGEGQMILDEKTLMIAETGPSKADHFHEAWEISWIKERFSALLICSKKSCGEVASICGHTSYDEDMDGKEMRHFDPLTIDPMPNIFPLHKNLPEKVALDLRKAFALFWIDSGACANRLRKSVETLLTERKIAKAVINKHRKSSLSLHDRIVRFQKVDKTSADYLFAVKWLGNVGSHSGPDKLPHDHLLDGFELIEKVIERVYAKEEARLSKVAKKITSRKGKP
jgi:hypothetical protein